MKNRKTRKPTNLKSKNKPRKNKKTVYPNVFGRRKSMPKLGFVLLFAAIGTYLAVFGFAAPRSGKSNALSLLTETYNSDPGDTCVSEDDQIQWWASGSLAPGATYTFTPKLGICTNSRAISASLGVAKGSNRISDLQFSVNVPDSPGQVLVAVRGSTQKLCMFPKAVETVHYTFTIKNTGTRPVDNINFTGQDRNDWPDNYYRQCEAADGDDDGWSDSIEHIMEQLTENNFTVAEKRTISGTSYRRPAGTPVALDEFDFVPSDFDDDGIITQNDVNLINSYAGQGNGITHYQITARDGSGGIYSWATQAFKWRRYDLNGDGYVNATDVSLVTSELGKEYKSSDYYGPAVTINKPLRGATVYGIVNITGTAYPSGGVPITKVEIKVDGGVVATLTSSDFSYSWNSLTKTNGTRTIAAVAHDANGNTSSASINVVVAN